MDSFNNRVVSSCASSTPIEKKSKKRRRISKMSSRRARSYNAVPGGPQWPLVVDIKILEVLSMATRHEEPFGTVSSSDKEYWVFATRILNDYIQRQLSGVDQKSSKEVLRRVKALRNTYRHKRNDWMFEQIDVHQFFGYPGIKLPSSLFNDPPTTTTQEPSLECDAQGPSESIHPPSATDRPDHGRAFDRMMAVSGMKAWECRSLLMELTDFDVRLICTMGETYLPDLIEGFKEQSRKQKRRVGQ